MSVHGLKILDSTGRAAVVRSLGLRGATAIRSYRPYIQPHSPKPSGYLQQLSKAHPVWQRSFTTTTQTPTDKLRNAVSKAKHDHPFLFPTLLIASFASVCWLALLSYDEYTREKPKLGSFPPGVERHLRNAIWYTEIKPDPTIAADLFTKAIDLAEREGMDRFSSEFTGIHIRFAAALEKFGQAKGAVEILSQLVDDLVQRIEDIDLGRVAKRSSKAIKSNGSELQGLDAPSFAGNPSDAQESERSQLLKRVINCKVKVSHLYGSDYIQDDASARRVLNEAMQLLIGSMLDPKSLQFDQNRAGISAEEAAAMISDAASNHVEWGSFQPALEIFKLALFAVRQGEKGSPSCPEAFILSNIAGTLRLALASPNPIIDHKPATEETMKRARLILVNWADQSLRCAHAVKGGQQDNLCKLAVETSCSHLADALVELGDLKEARRIWELVLKDSTTQTEWKSSVSIAQSELKKIDHKEKRQ
jgi:tetratricopeptide (TPR) repeat protein